MKNYLYILTSTLLFCSFGYSQEELTPTKQIESKHHRFYAGPDVFWQHGKGHHTFRDGTEINATFNAVFGGLRLGYDYLKPQAFYFGMDGLAAMGRSFLEMQCSWPLYQWSHESKSKETPLFANIEQRYGYTFQSSISAKSTLTPFAGMGWYYIRPQFNRSYDLANWFYGAAGLRATQEFYKSFDAGFHLKVMYAFAGNAGNFWGYEAALPLTWHIGASKKWDLQFQPYLLKLNTDVIGFIFGTRLQAGYSF